jgi:hypothetical protein
MNSDLLFTDVIDEIGTDTGKLENPKQVAERVKMYIFVQDLLKKVQKCLAVDEDILKYIPMTNTTNSAYATSGYVGMYHPNAKEAKEFAKEFTTGLSMRLLLFTDSRFVYVNVMEFLNKGRMSFYNYADIPGIYIKRMTRSYIDIEKPKGQRKQQNVSYLIDFQAGKNLFFEYFPGKVGEEIIETIKATPQLKDKLTDKVVRAHKLDYVFNNPLFWKKAFIVVTIVFGICVGIVVIYLILALMNGQ